MSQEYDDRAPRSPLPPDIEDEIAVFVEKSLTWSNVAERPTGEREST